MNGRPDGSVEATIVPKDGEEEADLLALTSDRPGHGGAVRFAHQNQAFWARARLLGSAAGAGRTAYTLHLTADAGSAGSVMEWGYNNLSADQVAEARARLLLLNQKPEPSDRWTGGFLSSFDTGRREEKSLSESPFPGLWQASGHRDAAFLRQARLWAVFYLKASGLCEHIVELALGPVQGGLLPVRFRGRRRKAHVNQEAAVIGFEGTCPLAS